MWGYLCVRVCVLLSVYVCMHVYFYMHLHVYVSTCMCMCMFLCAYPRVEISKEDDLNADSDSDTMDVDTVSHDGGEEPKHGAKQPTGNPPKGIEGGVAPEPLPHFAVSFFPSSLLSNLC